MPVTTSAPRARRPTKDAVAAAAVDLARAAAAEVAGEGLVGEHLGSTADPDGSERVVIHRFASLAPGYRGWSWSVVVARAPRAKTATVSEVVLLPAGDAVLAPSWLPWAQRLQPGDVGPTDVLPRVEDDPRLVQGYEATDEAEGRSGDAEDDTALSRFWEIGLGRRRLLGPKGRTEAASRWYEGAAGPTAPSARAAAAPCATCGFFVPLAGGLRQVFGVCANDWSPDDGRVVSLDHGCGAHSETDLVVPPEPATVPIVDDEALEPVALSPRPTD